jgi:hypothetical protein
MRLAALRKPNQALPRIRKWESLMSALYIGLAAVCGTGITACLGAMYLILRRIPTQRADLEA